MPSLLGVDSLCRCVARPMNLPGVSVCAECSAECQLGALERRVGALSANSALVQTSAEWRRQWPCTFSAHHPRRHDCAGSVGVDSDAGGVQGGLGAAKGGLSPKPTPDSHIRAQNHDGGALPKSPAAERTTAEKAKRRPNGNASHESVWHQPSRKEELTIVRNATRARGIFVGAKRRAACSHANCFAD